MDVSSATASQNTLSQTAASKQTETLGYNEFLKLLLAQMQNQDPLEPLSSTDYIAQLATFSNVEQAVNQNAKLDEIFMSSQLSQAGSIVGLNVTSADGTISGVVTSVKIDSAGAVAKLSNGKELVLESGITVRAA